MLLRISFRQIEISDIGPECRFLPDDGDYERHFRHVGEDVSAIEGVTSVEALDDHLVASTEGLDLQEFKLKLKPILQAHFQYLRISGPIEVVG